jgi:hypothetical protein
LHSLPTPPLHLPSHFVISGQKETIFWTLENSGQKETDFWTEKNPTFLETNF